MSAENRIWSSRHRPKSTITGIIGPCNIRHSAKPVGTREYFDEVEQRKYFVEPHIPRLAEFPRWHEKRSAGDRLRHRHRHDQLCPPRRLGDGGGSDRKVPGNRSAAGRTSSGFRTVSASTKPTPRSSTAWSRSSPTT